MATKQDERRGEMSEHVTRTSFTIRIKSKERAGLILNPWYKNLQGCKFEVIEPIDKESNSYVIMEDGFAGYLIYKEDCEKIND